MGRTRCISMLMLSKTQKLNKMKIQSGIHTIVALTWSIACSVVANRSFASETSIQIENPITITIDSKSSDWKPVRQAFELGAIVRIQYLSGQWRSNPSHKFHGPTGSGIPAPHEHYKVKGLAEGALLFRIGDSPAEILPEGDMRITKDMLNKTFYFIMNDQDYRDNEGVITLEIGTPKKAVIHKKE